VRDAGTGALAPRFIVIANIEPADGGAAIAAGNSRVLSARLDSFASASSGVTINTGSSASFASSNRSRWVAESTSRAFCNRPVEATTLVIGGIVGSSIFLVPAFVADEVGGPGIALLVWALAGILAGCGALSFAELGAAIPETGGTYTFLRRAYNSQFLAFLFGWTMFFAISTAAIGAVGIAVALYAGYFLSKIITYDTWAIRIVAVIVILSLTTVNALGVRVGGKTQNFFTLIKVLIVTGVILLSFGSGKGEVSRIGHFLQEGTSATDALTSIGPALILTLFAFSGWHFSTHVAGEIRDPEKNIPLSIIVSIAFVFTVYLLINVSFIYLLPFDTLRNSPFVGAEAMEVVLGPPGGAVIAAAVLILVLGAMNAQLLNYPRIVFALASDGLFFRAVSRINPKTRAPTIAICIQGLWASGFALTGSYREVLTAVAFVNHLFLTLAVVGVMVLRVREPDLKRPYRTWGYPIPPLLFLVISVWFLGNLLITRSAGSLMGVAIMLTGLPFYFYWSTKVRRDAETK